MGTFGNPGGAGASRSHRAVHRTVLAVDVERFGAHERTNPHRLVVRDGLYRSLRTALAKVGIVLADCHHEDRGDGVLVLIPPDVAKSVLIERLPHGLAAVLREHNETHGAQEQIRLRVSIHAGEIHQDPYGVVGDAVNYTFRLLDSPALRTALRESTGTLALIVSDWFFREVVRHSTDGNAAEYQCIRVVEKETDTAAWIYLPDDRSAAPTLPAPRRPDSPTPLSSRASRILWTASDRSARRLGARRTAYPLDLSIAELHNRGLYVPATFSDPAKGLSHLRVDDLAAKIEAGTSILVLGEPGSGKSVASYALLHRIRQHSPAIAARVSDLRAALDSSTRSTDLAIALREARTREGAPPVLVVDGLDETLGEFDSSADLAELLRQLGDWFTMVVTCRRREFEDNLASAVDGGSFESIYSIETWTLHGQFAEFVRRLVAAGLLESERLFNVIAGSADLARMIVRPLYARMLTFLGREGLSAVTDVSSLYAEYIDKLAMASDAALTAAGCRLRSRSGDIWVDAAWHIFAGGLLHEDRFDFEPVTAFLVNRFAERATCLSRALSQVCDQWRSGGRVRGRFVHYSFFEYLVSRYYVRQLSEALPAGTPALTECLGVDPSPEIRHFVVDELRETQGPGLSDALAEAYLGMRAASPRTVRTRTTSNLIAYLLSRVARNGRASLRRLLDDEDDMFLQQSILWGLCHLGDNDALAVFVRKARASARWRAWNRGYVMYYYGDIDRQAEPPYVDEDRRRGWGRTRERSITFMSEGKYRSVAPQRKYLDLYLLYDYAIWRGEELSAEEARVAKATLVELWGGSDIEGSYLLELQAMHAVVCPL